MRFAASDVFGGGSSKAKLARLLVLPLVLLMTIAASRANSFVVPEKPPALPSSAVFVGGADGGDWVSCSPGPENVIHCVVYWPTGGRPRYESWFRFCSMLSGGGHMRPANARPITLVGIGAVFDEVPFFFDRPSKFVPRQGSSREEITEQHEINTDYYERFGVTKDCRPSSNKTELVMHVPGVRK